MKQLVLKIWKYLKILKILLLLSFQLLTEYRRSFLFSAVSIAMWLIADFFWIYIIYTFTDKFVGYSIWEYIGFLGYFFFIMNLFWFIFDNTLNRLSNDIYDGRIDMKIVRPLDSQFANSFGEFHIPSFINIFFGLLTICFAIVKTGMVITFIKMLTLIITTVLTIISLYSLLFGLFCFTFWIGRSSALKGFINSVIANTSRIPAHVYTGFLKFLFFIIIPSALIVTVPSQIIFFEIPWGWIAYYTVFTFVAFVISRRIWHAGLRVYTSVSS